MRAVHGRDVLLFTGFGRAIVQRECRDRAAQQPLRCSERFRLLQPMLPTTFAPSRLRPRMGCASLRRR